MYHQKYKIKEIYPKIKKKTLNMHLYYAKPNYKTSFILAH